MELRAVSYKNVIRSVGALFSGAFFVLLLGAFAKVIFFDYTWKFAFWKAVSWLLVIFAVILLLFAKPIFKFMEVNVIKKEEPTGF